MLGLPQQPRSGFPTDVEETDDIFELKIEAPGIKKKNITVNVSEKNLLEVEFFLYHSFCILK